MPRRRGDAERKAMFRNMGKGATVRLEKQFGINDVPVGSKGIVVGHFGNRKDEPIVAFSGYGRKVIRPDLIKVINPSNKFNPIKYEKIKVYGSRDELIKKIKDLGYKFSNITPDGYASAYIPVFDEYGHQSDVPYSIKINDNSVDVHLNKKDVPYSHRDDMIVDEIRREAIDEVKSALGVSD